MTQPISPCATSLGRGDRERSPRAASFKARHKYWCIWNCDATDCDCGAIKSAEGGDEK